MIIHFLRHAQAEPFQPGKHDHDRDRLLTDVGRTQIQLAAKSFQKLGVQFDAVISSPYSRAVETAKIVADVFHFREAFQLTENLIPDAFYHKFRKEFLASWVSFNSILFVTHQPFVSECISCLLTGKDIPLAVDMGTGTLCTLEVDPALKGPAILHSMIRAEAIAGMTSQPSVVH